MKKLSIICMTILAVSFLASCRGPQGPQGPSGNDGNANVASSTLTIYPEDWTWKTFYTDANGNPRGEYSVEVDYPAINANVYNHGAVLVYMDVDGAWRQVPLTYYYYTNAVDENGNPLLYEASIQVETLGDEGLRLFWTQFDFWKVDIDKPYDFKIVAIEANLFADRSDVDYSSYEAVKTAFRLAD